MKSKHRKILILLVICAVALVVSTVLLTVHHNTSRSLTVIYIPKSSMQNNDFWASVRAGAETSAKENDVTLEVMAPPDETHIEEQSKLIEEAAARHPDAIAVAPASRTENTEALKLVKRTGIPLVYVDSMTDEDLADATVSTDNVAAGAKMAEPMLETLTDDDKIAIVSHVKESSTAQEREEGFRKGLGTHASQIVATVYSNSSVDTAYQVTLDLLEKNPDIGYIACLNEDSAVGAARAVEELGLSGSIVLVGFDNSTEEIEGLEEGTFKAIVVQKAFTMGYFGIEKAAELARGKTVDHETDSGSALVTRDNMYTEENQEILFPFY